MFVNTGMTASRHSNNSGVGIGSRAYDVGEDFLSKDHSESVVIGLNDVKVEPSNTASQMKGVAALRGVWQSNRSLIFLTLFKKNWL